VNKVSYKTTENERKFCKTWTKRSVATCSNRVSLSHLDNDVPFEKMYNRIFITDYHVSASNVAFWLRYGEFTLSKLLNLHNCDCLSCLAVNVAFCYSHMYYTYIHTYILYYAVRQHMHVKTYS